MDILWGAGILLSLAGGYLLILAVCAILGLLLGIPGMIVGGLQRAPTRQKRFKPPAALGVGMPRKMTAGTPGRKEKIVTSSLVSIAWLIIAILAMVWVR